VSPKSSTSSPPGRPQMVAVARRHEGNRHTVPGAFVVLTLSVGNTLQKTRGAQTVRERIMRTSCATPAPRGPLIQDNLEAFTPQRARACPCQSIARDAGKVKCPAVRWEEGRE
jgi:hypothetical protein